MAGKGIEIPITADTKQFITNTKKAEDTLDKFGDSLDAVSQDGRTAAERLDDAFDKVDFKIAAVEADQAASKIKTSFKEAAATVGVSTKKIGDDAKGNIGKVGSEVGSEFSQSFGEAIRAGNPAEAVTEVLTSLGPALGPIGVGLAATFGLGKKLIDDMGAAAATAKILGQQIFDAASDGFVTAAEKESLWTAALGADNLTDAVKKAQEIGKGLGVSSTILIAALKGDAGAIDIVNGAIDRNTTSTKGWAGVAQALGNTTSNYFGDAEESARATQSAVEGVRLATLDAKAAAKELDRVWRLELLKSVNEVVAAGGTARGITNAERNDNVGRSRP